MYRTLIVEPHDFSLNTLLELPVWNGNFECSKIASNGQEALELAQSENFDLILTEINLPIIDGLQLLKILHKDNQPPLIVFISDVISFSYAREGFIYGAFDYLPKPVNTRTMQTLFERAAKELGKHANLHFDSEKIDAIVNGMIHNRTDVIEEFCDMVRDLYSDKANIIQPDFAANKLYTTVVDGIYDIDSWLRLYLPKNFHRQGDYIMLRSLDDYIAYYRSNLTYLYDIIYQFSPKFNDETLTKIYLYMLNNPEDDLKLTSIASKFFLNHTYLSNLFSQKSDIHYSQLVTSIKLRRAEYLIKYTSTPLMDISEQLGYKDYHYFCRLYKNIIGKSPMDYVRCDDWNNYSI